MITSVAYIPGEQVCLLPQMNSAKYKIECPRHRPLPGHKPLGIRRKGFFNRLCDGSKVRRFECLECGATFSEATSTLEYRQRKRSINEFLFVLLASNNSMRRAAIICKIARKTVERRLLYFSKVAERYQKKLLASLPQEKELQFDDMESSEHTKMKPLSIPLVVTHPTRLILASDVASMPAKGPLAEKSRAKYGRRSDDRVLAWQNVLSKASRVAVPGVIITSDSHRRYPAAIKKILPNATHRQVKGRRGCVAGQGELKVGGRDPLFSLNHTAAMLRANICRLIRKTWCTTKKKENLRLHVTLYMMWHNETILANLQGRQRSFPFPDGKVKH